MLAAAASGPSLGLIGMINGNIWLTGAQVFSDVSPQRMFATNRTKHAIVFNESRAHRSGAGSLSFSSAYAIAPELYAELICVCAVFPIVDNLLPRVTGTGRTRKKIVRCMTSKTALITAQKRLREAVEWYARRG
jgi:hypothetical protein